MTKRIRKNGLLFGLTYMFVALCLCGVVSAQGNMPRPGTTIDKSNYNQYKEFFPEFFHEAFTTGWELVEPVKITIQATSPNPFPKPFLDATARNKGKYSIDAEGYIAGGEYESIAGFPFPDPDPNDKDFAAKIMWNYDYKYKCDSMHSEFMNFEKRRGESVTISTVESWQLQFQNRLYLDPKPLYKTKNGLRQINFLRNVYPPVQRNFMTLLVRYIDQKAPDATFLYLPSLRRTLRGEAGERSTPIMSSTQAPDDFDGGFAGRTPEFTYKYLGEKKMIVLADAKLGMKDMRDLEVEMVPVESDGWQVKDVHIIEITPKDPKYPQGKKVVYIDKEHYWAYYAAAWDRAGALWKVWQTAVNKQANEAGEAYPYFKGMLGVDTQLGYAVQMFADWGANGENLKESDVSPTSMRRRAR
ncbi:DUF1329 domain-containing protein [Thermodesulfobacteriota bacterium]